MREVMLTTIDNPYDPFLQFDEWRALDDHMGYHTCEYLARITPTSPNISYADQARLLEEAIDEIVEINALGVYKKVVREIDEDAASSS